MLKLYAVFDLISTMCPYFFLKKNVQFTQLTRDVTIYRYQYISIVTWAMILYRKKSCYVYSIDNILFTIAIVSKVFEPRDFHLKFLGLGTKRKLNGNRMYIFSISAKISEL